MYAAPDRLLRNRKNRAFFLAPDDRITFVAEANEIALVDPLLLQEFDRRHRVRADEEEDGAARDFIVFFGERVRIVWRAVGRAPPDDAMDVHVGQTGEFGVARVHAPNMGSERHLLATRIV